MSKIDRRFMLRVLSWSGLFVLAKPVRTLAKQCEAVVRTDRGPFYPEKTIPLAQDLTRVPGRRGAARGRLLYLTGKVTLPDCDPLPDAVVEIWQTDDNGSYDHTAAETNGKALDPCFRYFAKVRTAADGTFVFKTIRPRPYEFRGLHRASHIHVRVQHAKARTLVSEVYFEGARDDRLREEDRVYQGRGPRKETLIVPLEDDTILVEANLKPEPGAACCRFDVALDPN